MAPLPQPTAPRDPPPLVPEAFRRLGVSDSSMERLPNDVPEEFDRTVIEGDRTTTAARNLLCYRFTRWAMHVARRMVPGQSLKQAIRLYWEGAAAEDPRLVWLLGVHADPEMYKPGFPSTYPLPGQAQAQDAVALYGCEKWRLPQILREVLPPNRNRVLIHPGFFIDETESMASNRAYCFVLLWTIALRALRMRVKCEYRIDEALAGMDPDYDMPPGTTPGAFFQQLCSLWPTVEELFKVESDILTFCADKCAEHTTSRELREELMASYGLTEFEAADFVQTGRAWVHEMNPSDIESERAIMRVRLEHVQSLARQTGDHRAELAALREYARISGLTRDAAGGVEDEFEVAIEMAAKRREQQAAQLYPHEPSGSYLLEPAYERQKD